VKVACVGGGPASLYFSILMKRVDPSHEITVYERYPAGATYGWGVTYWEELFDYLHEVDPESARAIGESSVRWDSWVVHVQDRATVVVEHGDEGFGVGRQRMLDILAARATELGVRIEYEREITAEAEFPDADLVVAADGINSVLRERDAGHYGTEVSVGRNMYMWLGTTKALDAFTFAFTETPHGWIWGYGYGYDPGHSTFIVECAPDTWRGLGLDTASEADGLAQLEKLFAEVLDGHPLLTSTEGGGSARWLNFRTLTNRRWYRDNVVLLGDAAHTTHYSIGAGTALALGDAAYLVEALHAEPELSRALARYERERRAAIRVSQRAARNSSRWYENVPRYIDLPPKQMVALLNERHSRLLPLLPPRLYYFLGQSAENLSLLAAKLIPGRRPRISE
jgi:2-polyprenyl-6-methoxyphenol hydroxylase-like FAD-dependent oxidoreductase